MENIIKTITIKNFKGINQKSLKFEKLIPNHVNIVVGRNGAGKSTLTKILNYASKNFNIDTPEWYKKANGDLLKPQLIIESKINNKNVRLVADDTKNEIKDKYEIIVVKSPLVAKSRPIKFANYTSNKAKLALEDVDIIKVEYKVDKIYSIKEVKSTLDIWCKKFFSNLLTLFNEIKFVEIIVNNYDMFTQTRVSNTINEFINNISKFSSVNKSEFEACILDDKSYLSLLENDKIKSIFDKICSATNQSEIESIMTIVQIQQYISHIYSNKLSRNDFSNKDILKMHEKYLKNKKVVEYIREFIENINTTNRIILHENNKKLVLSLPDVDSISNGERDLLYLTAKLLNILYNFNNKRQKIIVLDEIFDYLDGANLLVFQYLILKLIKDYKINDSKAYFILFTHLDPSLFNTFTMNRYTNIVYFGGEDALKIDETINKMIFNRNNSKYSFDISKYYLHYSPDEKLLQLKVICVTMKGSL